MKSMHQRTLWIAFVGLLMSVTGCGKDEKATSPEPPVPSVSVTLGGDTLNFGAIGAGYDGTWKFLILAFAQGPSGGFPTCTVGLNGADSLQTGVEAECVVTILPDSSNVYLCGPLAGNDSAVAVVSFSQKDLSQGGLVSGDVNGLLVHSSHSAEPLVPVAIQFRNIPVEVSN